METASVNIGLRFSVVLLELLWTSEHMLSIEVKAHIMLNMELLVKKFPSVIPSRNVLLLQLATFPNLLPSTPANYVDIGNAGDVNNIMTSGYVYVLFTEGQR